MNDEQLYRVDITERQEETKDASWTIRYTWEISEAALYDGIYKRGIYMSPPAALSVSENLTHTVIGESAEEATDVARAWVERQKQLTEDALNTVSENAKERLRP